MFSIWSAILYGLLTVSHWSIYRLICAVTVRYGLYHAYHLTLSTADNQKQPNSQQLCYVIVIIIIIIIVVFSRRDSNVHTKNVFDDGSILFRNRDLRSQSDSGSVVNQYQLLLWRGGGGGGGGRPQRVPKYADF